MASYIVSVSPKGQITIPVNERRNCKSKKYLLEVKGSSIILRPIAIKVVDNAPKVDEIDDFQALAESNFNFWKNKKDDIYQKFYSKNS